MSAIADDASLPSFREVLEPRLCDSIVTSFDGQVNDSGLFEGVGTADLDNGLQYEGSFVNGLMHGDGKVTWPDGTIYQGKLVAGVVRHPARSPQLSPPPLMPRTDVSPAR